MKKLLFCILFAICTMTIVNAQSKALGLRFNSVGSVEASFQTYLSDATRLELDLGLGTESVIYGAAIYQWVMDLSQLASGFKWYAGIGGGALIHDSGIGLGFLGNLGLEYNFDFPLQLSLDIRPGFYFGDYGSGFGFGGGAFAIRYKF